MPVQNDPTSNDLRLVKRTVRPIVFKKPSLNHDGTVMVPPNAAFACAGCYWKDGQRTRFSIQAYANHLNICPNARDWMLIEEQAAANGVDDELATSSKKKRRNSNGSTEKTLCKDKNVKQPPKLRHADESPLAKRIVGKSIANTPQNGSIPHTKEEVQTKEMVDPHNPSPPKPSSDTDETSGKRGALAPKPVTYRPTTYLQGESPVSPHKDAAAPWPTPHLVAAMPTTLTTMATDSTVKHGSGYSASTARTEMNSASTKEIEMKAKAKEQRAKRMLAELAATNHMPITTTRWYSPEFEPLYDGPEKRPKIDGSPDDTKATTRKSHRKRAPPAKFRDTNMARQKMPLEYTDFEKLWAMAEDSFLERTAEAVEAQNQFRNANKRMDPSDTVHQASAQYGRIEFAASEILLDALAVEKTDTFLDIGHGLANVVLQAAYVRGCTSRGIEVVRVRYEASIQFEFALRDAKIARELQWDVDYGNMGKVDLRCGRLEDPDHMEFLTIPSTNRVGRSGAMKVFFNNYGAVFADKSAKRGNKHYLDDFVAGLFCSMPEGSILISCNRLNMPGTRSQIQRQRGDAAETGFYEYDTVDLGPANLAVSWAGGSNFHRIVGHKYTRVGPGYYICGKCGKRTDAYQTVEGGQRVPNICCMDNVAGLRPRNKSKQRKTRNA